MSRPKKIKVSQEVKETSINQLEEDAKKELKDRKKKNVFAEIGSFLILILIVVLLGFSTFYWYDNYYDSSKKYESNNDNTEEKEEEKTYELLSFQNDNAYQNLNDEYYVALNNEEIKQVITKSGKVIFDSEILVNNAYIGLDNNLYLYLKEQGDYANQVEIYMYKDDNWEKIQTLGQINMYYQEIIFKEENHEYLIGFYGVSSDNETNEIYLINDEIISLKDYQVISDTISKEKIYTVAEDYLTIKNQDEAKIFKISSKEMILEEDYTTIIKDYQGNFIVKNNDKWGIIDETQRIIVPFNYEYITRSSSLYYLYKDDTITILDENFKNVADMPLNTLLNPSDFIDINVYQVEDNYYYTNKITSENYLIKKDGTKKKIEENLTYNQENNLLFKEDKTKKIYTFYNKDGEEEYSINLSSYDTKKISFTKELDKYLVATVGKNIIHYDIETGEKIESIEPYTYKIGNISLTYDNKDIVEISDGDTTKTIKITSNFYENLKINQDKTFIYLNNNELFIITPKK